MEKQLIDKETISNELAEEIKKLVLEARNKISKEINGTLEMYITMWTWYFAIKF